MNAGFRGRAALLFLIALLSAALPARADWIKLQNDVSVRGIAGTIEDGMLKVQVDVEGSVYYPASQVVEIRRETPRENEALRRQWRKAKEPPDAAVQGKQPESLPAPLPVSDARAGMMAAAEDGKVLCWSPYGFRYDHGKFTARIPYRNSEGLAYAPAYDKGIQKMSREECDGIWRTNLVIWQAEGLRGEEPAVYPNPGILDAGKLHPAILDPRKHY